MKHFIKFDIDFWNSEIKLLNLEEIECLISEYSEGGKSYDDPHSSRIVTLLQDQRRYLIGKAVADDDSHGGVIGF